MTHSSTGALLWEIWRRHRGLVAVIIAATAMGRLFDVQSDSSDSSVVAELLQLTSFVLLFGIFSYTESGDSRALGHFPQRLFVLPVSSLRLAAVPVCAGVASVELLYLMWLNPAASSGSGSVALHAILLGALMVCSQAAIWTLDRLGPFRLVVVGLLAVAAFAVGLLPSMAPSPPPPWRSEGVLSALTLAVSLLGFGWIWRHIARMRSGGGAGVLPVDLLDRILTACMPQRRRAFGSPGAAQFWLEWRCSGVVLPLLVLGVLLAVVAPLSWLTRYDADDTLRILIGTLSMPVVLAMAVGVGFGRPSFWSDDLSVPAFMAVRPLADAALVAVKVKVAAASAVVSWVLLLVFVGAWLTLWGNVEALSRLAVQLWAFHGQSVAAVYGIATLIVVAALFLTWRFLVSRLWSGLSGHRRRFFGSAAFFGLATLGWFILDGTRVLLWVVDDPAHMNIAAWVLAVAVVGKYWLAASTWRDLDACYLRRYLWVWLAGTSVFGVLALLLWNIVRIYVALDIVRFQGLLILVVLLAMPLARMGAAPASLAGNRHR